MEYLANMLAIREPRERWLLFFLASVVVPVTVIFLVNLPLAQRIRAVEAQAAESQDLLRWLSTQAATVDLAALAAGPAPDPTPGTARPTAADLERSLRQAGLDRDVSRLAVGQDGRIVLGFEDVGFGNAMVWLETTHAAGLKVIDLRIEARDAPGRVALDATLGGSQ